MHCEGVYISVWDQHADFLAKQVADLATSNASESAGLLSLMRKDYEKALNEIEMKYLCITNQLEINGDSSLLPYHSIEDPLPEDGLFSVALEAYKSLLFDSTAAAKYSEQLQTDEQLFFENFRKEKLGEHSSLSSQFEIQQFSRQEISRWLNQRGVVSKYLFAPGTSIEPKENTTREVKTADRKGWLDIVGPYVIEVQRTRRIGTAKNFYKALLADAQAGQGPFEVGEGDQRGSLIVTVTGKAVSSKTLANRWAEIQDKARKAP